MIARAEPEYTLMDCEALSVALKRPVSTIRRHCQAVATDVKTRRQLYDEDASRELLSKVPRREPHKRRKRRS